MNDLKKFIRTTIQELFSQEIDYSKEIILEARFSDVEVIPSKGKQRGASDVKGRSFDIIIGNPGVYHKMEETPMGYSGTIQVFAGDGPNTGLYKQYKWTPDTTQWTVWSNINYIILSENNEVHWYNGKIPGGTFGVRKASSGEGDGAGVDAATGQKYVSGKPNQALPTLTVKEFGYKVYKALLLEPSVGFIISDKHATPQVKNAVYSKLIKDNDFVWMMVGGNTIDTYEKIIIINPNYADINSIKQRFEKEQFYYSRNFPK